MKKLCIIVTVLLLCTSAYAKIPVRVSIGGETELGTDVESYNSFFDLELNLNVYFWKCKWTTYAGNRVWFVLDFPADKLVTGYPFRNIYFYGTRFNIAGFFIDYQHFCNHPVKTSQIHDGYVEVEGNRFYSLNKKWWSNYWGETLDTISIGCEFEFDVYHN